MAAATAVLWRIRLGSAVRAAVACSIVGGVTLFGPAPVRQMLTFSAFSYVTAISTVLSDAVTFGHAVRAGFHVACAVALVLVSSVPCLWLIGPARFDRWAASLAVAVSGFVVALLERAHLLTKRIAFGQLVIVYVGTVINGGETSFFMHPLRVASSTAAGAIAAAVAMIIPYPRLSSCQMKTLGKVYRENVCERVGILVQVFGAKSKAEAATSIAEVKSLSTMGTKLLHMIKTNMRGMDWERPRIGHGRLNRVAVAEKLEEFEVAVRGMEFALTSPSFAFETMDEELCNLPKNLKPRLILKLQQLKCSVPASATTAPETKGLFPDTWPLGSSPIIPQNMPPSFFLRCVKILLYDSTAAARTLVYRVENGRRANGEEAIDLGEHGTKNTRRAILSNMLPTNQSLRFALKCSITLGLAVFLGLVYTKPNGYWSGLTVAISFATERQATFTVANARAQGTAIGSIYGVICCFILQKYEYLWILPLIPWVAFTSFLVHSRMYGQGGGISSALGALLVLGRKNYGIPSEFANARITEACIGLLCFVTVEVVFNPTRSATLAKAEFSKSLRALQDCIRRVILIPQKNLNNESSILLELIEQHKFLKSHVAQLEKFIVEAGYEPNFWFTPFQGSCYDKLLKSLQKTVDILQFLVHEMRLLSLELNRYGHVVKELHDSLSEDMELFSIKVQRSLKFMEKASLVKSLKQLQNKNQNQSDEMEMGKSQNDGCRALGLSEEEVEKIVGSFRQNANEILSKVYTNDEGEANLKGQMTLCLSSVGFCMECLMRETMVMEKEVLQLLKLENPSIHMNLQELSTQINAHQTQ
ncbi:uncharacterized protein LOC111013682 [Momordica charantia]|uniref:Uncharacterized protein LOC111013682 n=1 Tax=Momordica charantia TaxID=3673 RepID=A0A6J1CQM6_MOMCH|nr:uncharacterized protein LOC111013682 [Momordica charantia]